MPVCLMKFFEKYETFRIKDILKKKDERKEMDITDFLSSYPVLDDEDREALKEILPPSERPQWDWYRKNEFYENRQKMENLPEEKEEKEEKKDGFLPHQINVARFMSTHGTLSGLLLLHEPGTGKTSAAIRMIEQLRAETGENPYRKALILTRNDATKKTFKEERKKRMENDTVKRDDFYEYDTHETFANKIEQLESSSTQFQKYNQSIIVIDEVHALGEPSKSDQRSKYDRYLSFLSQVRDCKVLLLTGTPMENKANEIAYILNLLHPRLLPTGTDFDKEYLNDDLTVREDKRQHLKNKIHSYVSTLRAPLTNVDVQKKYVGNLIYDSFRLQPVELSDVQGQAMINLFQPEQKDTAYSKTQQANLMVFPVRDRNKTIKPTVAEGGIDTGLKQMVDHVDQNVTKWEWKKDQDLFQGCTTDEERVTELKKWSAKYAACVESILQHPDELHFAYCENVNGGGLHFFAFLLSKFQKVKAQLLTGQEGKADEIITKFNQDVNYNGTLINVLLGSEVLAEAFTLKNVRHVHFLTVPWHYSRIDQVIARTVRYGSHDYLIESKGMTDVDVTVHFYCAIPKKQFVFVNHDFDINVSDDEELEISLAKHSYDFFVYQRCQEKDRSIKSVERLIFEASVDCALNYARNRVWDEGKNNTRICQYQSCEYTCDGMDGIDLLAPLGEDEIDYSTYNLFYSPVRELFEARIRANRVPFSISDFARDVKQPERACWIEITKRIHQGMFVRDELGFPLFVQLDQDWVYLTRELPTRRPCVLDAGDQIEMYRKVENVLPNMVRTQLPHTLNRLLEGTWSDSEYREYLSVLPDDFQEELLEQAYLYDRVHASSSSSEQGKMKAQFCKFVVTELGNFLSKSDQGVISKRLTTRWRILRQNKNEWEDVSREIRDSAAIDSYKKEVELLRQKGSRYFGFMATGKVKVEFKVLDAEIYKLDDGQLKAWVEQQQEEKDGKGLGNLTKKVKTGEVCTSCDRFKLLQTLGEYMIPLPDRTEKKKKSTFLRDAISKTFPEKNRLTDLTPEELETLYSDQELVISLEDIVVHLFPEKELKDLTNDELDQVYRFLPVRKNKKGDSKENDLQLAFDKKTFAKFATEKKLLLLTWSRFDKSDMCKAIHDFFVQTGRMISQETVVKAANEVKEKITKINEEIMSKPSRSKSSKPSKPSNT